MSRPDDIPPIAKLLLRNGCTLYAIGRPGTLTLDIEIHGNENGHAVARTNIDRDTPLQAFGGDTSTRIAIGDWRVYVHGEPDEAKSAARTFIEHITKQFDSADDGETAALAQHYAESLQRIPAPDITPCPPGSTPRDIALDERKGAAP